jgi:hypothetical protein
MNSEREITLVNGARAFAEGVLTEFRQKQPEAFLGMVRAVRAGYAHFDIVVAAAASAMPVLEVRFRTEEGSDLIGYVTMKQRDVEPQSATLQ